MIYSGNGGGDDNDDGGGGSGGGDMGVQLIGVTKMRKCQAWSMTVVHVATRLTRAYEKPLVGLEL